MGNDWTPTLVPLDELTETPITYGVVKPGDEGDVVFVRGGDIAGGRVLTNQLRTISRDVSNQYRRTALRGGELLVSLVGNPGQVAIAPPELAGANIARQVGLVRLRSTINPRFVSYYLQSPIGQAALGAQSLGSVQQVINLRDLRNVKIPLLSPSDQDSIAHILGTLDDKIELNRRMNATLEAMARALFQSWFVDFDPVRAKAAGQTPAGMNKATADLFPASFETATIGKVPRGWRVRYLLELCDFEYGKPLKEADRAGGQVPVYGSNGIVGWHNQSLVEGPGVVIGRKGTAGTVTWAATDFFPIDTTFWIKPKPDAPPLSYLFLQLENMKLNRLTADSAVPGLNRNAAYSQLVVSPTLAVLQHFEKIVMPLFSLIHLNELETRTLSQLRDTLLPELLQGRLTVAVQ